MRMTEEQALTVLEEVIEHRRRWGNLGGNGPHSQSDLMDALVLLSERLTGVNEETAREVTKLKRQLGASKAREARLNKRNQALVAELQDLKQAPESPA